MSANPPVDFDLYKKWRRTSQGREWFREQLFRQHVLFRCEQCGDEVWMVQGSGLGDEMPCPFPCGGVKARQRKPQWWEEKA